MAIGAVTALSPDEHMTGILTARDIEYAAANVGVAWNMKYDTQLNAEWNLGFYSFLSFIKVNFPNRQSCLCYNVKTFNCKLPFYSVFSMYRFLWVSLCVTFSTNPRTPDFEGLEHFPPSV